VAFGNREALRRFERDYLNPNQRTHMAKRDDQPGHQEHASDRPLSSKGMETHGFGMRLSTARIRGPLGISCRSQQGSDG
jgi:hypothetical protein